MFGEINQEPKSRDTVTLILQAQFFVVYVYTLDEFINFPYTNVLIVWLRV